MKKFMEVCERGGGELMRDLFIFEKYVCNMARSLAKETYKLDKNDAQSMHMWVQNNPFLVFYYKEFGSTI